MSRGIEIHEVLNETTKEELDYAIKHVDDRLCLYCKNGDCRYLTIKKKDFVYCCLHVIPEYINEPISNWLCRTCALRVWNTKFITWEGSAYN